MYYRDGDKYENKYKKLKKFFSVAIMIFLLFTVNSAEAGNVKANTSVKLGKSDFDVTVFYNLIKIKQIKEIAGDVETIKLELLKNSKIIKNTNIDARKDNTFSVKGLKSNSVYSMKLIPVMNDGSEGIPYTRKIRTGVNIKPVIKEIKVKNIKIETSRMVKPGYWSLGKWHQGRVAVFTHTYIKISLSLRKKVKRIKGLEVFFDGDKVKMKGKGKVFKGTVRAFGRNAKNTIGSFKVRTYVQGGQESGYGPWSKTLKMQIK